LRTPIKKPKIFGFGKKEPTDIETAAAESTRIADLLAIIKTLKQGELIEVCWLDASIARNRDISNLENKEFATYKRTPGYFAKLVTDHRYNEYHLILVVEETDFSTGFEMNRRYDIMSIPLGIVRKIKREMKQGQILTKRDKSLRLKGSRRSPGEADAIQRIVVSAVSMRWGRIKPLDRNGAKIILSKDQKGRALKDQKRER
jgi:hypothetical protein